MTPTLFELRGAQAALAAVFVASVTTGCASTADDTFRPGTTGEKIGRLLNVTGGPPVQYSLDERGQATLAVMLGEYAAQRGNHAVAATEYRKAAEITRQPDLAREAVRQSLQAGDRESALRATALWAQLEPDEPRARQAAFRVALDKLHSDDSVSIEETVELGKALVAEHPEGPGRGLLEVTAMLSADRGSPQTTLDIAEPIAADWPEVPEAAFLRGSMLIDLRDFDGAARAADRALALRPGWPEAGLLRAGIEIEQGNALTAVALMDPLLASGNEPDLRFKFARLLLQAEAYAPARAQLRRVLAEDPDNHDARFAYALLALEEAGPDDPEAVAIARTQFERLAAEPEFRSSANYYLGRLAQADGDEDAALALYSEVSGGPHLMEAIGRRAALTARGVDGGTLADARNYLQTLRAQNPRAAAEFLGMEAELLISNDAPAEALTLYDEALEADPDHQSLRYGRSLARERTGDIDGAKADLRALIRRDPKNAQALNALGYLLTNHGNSYKEAFALASRAAKLAPDDPAIMDTLGWAHYRLGELDQAQALLERAYAAQPDGEIAAHLGEVYWMQGDQDSARAVWQRALADEPEQAVLIETVTRLTGRAP